MAGGQEFEQEPIFYSRSQPANRVSRLLDKIAAGEKPLAHEEQLGYLRSLLAELDVPVSSQTLVFSKTSLQRQRISPRTPRALYFNDDVYVGFCQGGEVLEISAVDPQLGTVFYTLDQEIAVRPTIQRQTDNCLICHGSSMTKETPGHVLRSVFTAADGLPVLSAGTYRIDQTSPLEKRWGGWYVTGTHGDQKHLGNLIVRGRADPDEIDNSAGQNVTSLAGRFDTSAYLSPHSDIVALMVLEHQADAHNHLTRANHLTRQAMHYQQTLNRELGEPADHVWDSTKSRIKSAGEPLVEYLLFSGEAPLTAKVARHVGVRRGVRPPRPLRFAGPLAARVRPDASHLQISVQLSGLFAQLCGPARGSSRLCAAADVGGAQRARPDGEVRPPVARRPRGGARNPARNAARFARILESQGRLGRTALPERSAGPLSLTLTLRGSAMRH